MDASRSSRRGIWQERSWDLGFGDLQIICMMLPTPEGYVGLLQFSTAIASDSVREKLRLMAGCELLLFPSAWGEPLSRVPLEAGACAAAILAMPTGGTPSIIADGVSGAKGGRIASELAVRTLVEGLYDQPDTIGPAAAVARVMTPFNRWLHSMGKSATMRHAATTFTAFVLKGRRGHVLHVGDSRAWHFRDGRLTLLTQDHTRSHPDQNHILYRAIGIEERLRTT